MSVEKMRGFELLKRADLVIDYDGCDKICVSSHGKNLSTLVSEEHLSETLSSVTTNRGLVVVVFGPAIRHAFPEPALGSKADAMEKLIKAQGFSPVVFELGSAFGVFVYRE
jgi:hypothetical protein